MGARQLVDGGLPGIKVAGDLGRGRLAGTRRAGAARTGGTPPPPSPLFFQGRAKHAAAAAARIAAKAGRAPAGSRPPATQAMQAHAAARPSRILRKTRPEARPCFGLPSCARPPPSFRTLPDAPDDAGAFAFPQARGRITPAAGPAPPASTLCGCRRRRRRRWCFRPLHLVPQSRHTGAGGAIRRPKSSHLPQWLHT